MWGNRLGWILATCLLMLEILFVVMVSRQDWVSAPTSFSQQTEYLSPLEFPFSPTVVVPSMTRSEDTGATYREAINDVLASRDEYDAYNEKGKDSDKPRLRAIFLLHQAASSTRANIFLSQPEQVINYNGEKPELDALISAGRAALRAGLLRQKTDPADAQEHLEAAFSLGWKMYQERLSDAELRAGFDLFGQAALALEKLAENGGDSSRAQQLKDFNAARVQFYKNRIEPVRRIIISIDPNIIAGSIGDYFYFAKNATERVWKIEAVLAIGRLQYYVGENGRAANQSGARREIASLVDDPDPLVRCAAKAARDLTIEQYRQIR